MCCQPQYQLGPNINQPPHHRSTVFGMGDRVGTTCVVDRSISLDPTYTNHPITGQLCLGWVIREGRREGWVICEIEIAATTMSGGLT